MKSILSTLFMIASTATTALAAPGAVYISDWQEAGLRRYRYQFHEVSTDNYGQDFLQAIRNHGGVTNNWQCWQLNDYTWQFDVSEVDGYAGFQAVVNGVYDVTGQTCYQQGQAPLTCFNNGFSD